MLWLFDALPYLLAAGTIVLGALELINKWHEYKKPWLRISVGAAFVIVGAVSLISLYHDNAEKKQAAKKAETDMRDLHDNVLTLQGEVTQANHTQEVSTKTYLESVSELKAEVKTEALQKKLAAVELQLLNNQKAMAPGPKAQLVFSFDPFPNPPSPGSPTPVKEVTLPLASDGSVHVAVAVLNPSNVDAIDPTINLRICDQCRFAKEPEDSRKMPNVDDAAVRILNSPTIHSLEALHVKPLDIVPPAWASEISVGISYRCRTCVVHPAPTNEDLVIIHIQRSDGTH